MHVSSRTRIQRDEATHIIDLLLATESVILEPIRARTLWALIDLSGRTNP